MEKRKPAYSLTQLKAAFSSVRSLGRAITASAFRGAQEAACSREDIVTVIQALQPSDFYKSMTAYANVQQWQDVYYARFRGKVLYCKFTRTSAGGFLLLSFKEK
jgi:motility quorum-sensing regulator / GCU-specific mRNA interferase toxin